jgi:hypothetical protein
MSMRDDRTWIEARATKQFAQPNSERGALKQSGQLVRAGRRSSPAERASFALG